MFVHVSVCERVQLEVHSPENTSKITAVRALSCTLFHFIFNFNYSISLKVKEGNVIGTKH